MNEEYYNKLYYTKIIVKEDGSIEYYERNEQERLEYDKYVQDIRDKIENDPKYKYSKSIGYPDGTIELIPLTDEEIIELKKAYQNSFWISLRSRRDNILKESDALVLPDRWSTYSEDKKTKISDYRQALRDLPANVTYIEDKDINSYMPDKPY